MNCDIFVGPHVITLTRNIDNYEIILAAAAEKMADQAELQQFSINASASENQFLSNSSKMKHEYYVKPSFYACRVCKEHEGNRRFASVFERNALNADRMLEFFQVDVSL